MSIDDIKDIRKLQKMLKYERELRKYTYTCCEEAGKKLEKNSFAWDGKEKNLVIQAMELNERYDQLKQTLTEIREIAVEIENFAERIDEDNWGILNWKIIDKSKEILQKISECEVEND